MKILIYSPINLQEWGGAEIALANLSKHLAILGHEVIFITPSHTSIIRLDISDIIKDFEKNNVKLIIIDKFLSISNMKRFYDLIRYVDIIYFNNLFAHHEFMILFLSKISRRPIISVYQEPFLHNPNILHKIYVDVIKRYILRFYDGHHVLNLDYERYLISHRCKNILMIPNGIHIKSHNDKEKNKKFNILFVGRLAKQKGIDMLLNIIEMINSKYDYNVEFHIVGSGELYDLIYDFSIKYNNVKYYGFLSGIELENLYDKANVILIPSVWETQGMVSNEAQMCGTPAIVTNITGLKDTVIDGITGIIVQSNTPQNFLLAIEKIYILWNHDYEKYVKISNNARRYASKYKWDNISQNIETFFQKVLIEYQKR
ncbi:D-inositol-3-phosphate glycosyltransferase [uncultured archaeon]|nr:D-inositol-3-phosphate glycosyltransferase [uncultured archaeon]